MVLMEIVICLYAQVSVDHPGRGGDHLHGEATGDEGEKAPGVLFSVAPRMRFLIRQGSLSRTAGW